MPNITLLPNTHLSPETAYIVEDYPFGFKLRCKKRYWLEYHQKLGVRLATQTTNPKIPSEVWNKPKHGTYFRFGAALYLDDQNHVHCFGLSEYANFEESQNFLSTYGPAIPEAILPLLKQWVKMKQIYANALKDTNQE